MLDVEGIGKNKFLQGTLKLHYNRLNVLEGDKESFSVMLMEDKDFAFAIGPRDRPAMNLNKTCWKMKHS